jgi:hypothetical protein
MPLGRSVQRVQRHPSTGVGDSGFILPLGAESLYQSLQGRRHLLAQTLRLEELPVVKLGAVRQGETGHKVAGVQVDGFRQSSQAIGAQFRSGTVVLLRSGYAALEGLHVQPQLSLGVQADLLPVDGQCLGTKGLFEPGEIAT